MQRSVVEVGSLLALVLLAGACGGSGGGATAVTTPSISSSGSPSASPSPDPSSPDTDATPTAGHALYEQWFTRGDSLFLTLEEGPLVQSSGRAALELLLDGPSSEESWAKVRSVIPEGTELRDLDIEDEIATVDLSARFEDGGGSFGMRMRLAQVVFTVTQFPSVKGVELRLDGAPVETFSAEGIVLNGPQRRKDFGDLLPAILVQSPAIGETVSSPVEITGTANTFEATVEMRILDADGEELVSSFTTATCGSGCRGDFRERLAFDLATEEPGTVEVFESSAEDGRPINVVRIPVDLAP